jgi:succinate dehydrogenase / fumarate reductase, membrane anchor subunit
MSRQASGLKAWFVQRVTALYLALFLSYLLLHFCLHPPADHAALLAWVQRPLVAGGLMLFMPVVLAHAWVGIRDVLIDYVHHLGARLTLLTLFGFVFLASGLWAFKAIITAGLSA